VGVKGLGELGRYEGAKRVLRGLVGWAGVKGLTGWAGIKGLGGCEGPGLTK
jgi:hypothetical protein